MEGSLANTRQDRMNWLDKISQYGLVIARLIIGYLWYTQLLWKMPPLFGCPANFAVSTSFQSRTSGLCDWTGLMGIYSKVPLHAAFVNNFVIPNIRWMGWIIWLLEAFIMVSLIIGLFSRLGGLLGFVQALNLYIGLTAIPGEWYWTYGMLYTLQLVFFFLPPGRSLGIDAWLRPRLYTAAERGNRLAGALLWLT